MADIVYIDQEEGKKRLVNNARLYAKLLGKFRDEIKLEPVFAALDAGDYKEAQDLVHTIKGTSGNLSIKDLNEKLKELEIQIKAKSVDPQAIENIKASLAATLPELEKVIAENV